jgi:hypothetical protein
MAVVLSQYAGAGAQFFDNNGNPLAGGLIYTYAAGTTTPAATYTSSTGGTANANPIVLDSAGRTPAQIWLTAGNSYKFVLQTSLGTLIKTDDNIYAAFDLTKEVGVAVGLGAGSIATNIAVGDTALDSNTTGSNNVAVGYNALTSNTDGFQNVAVGSQALDANTSGDYNVAVGYDSLSAATTANYNTGGQHCARRRRVAAQPDWRQQRGRGLSGSRRVYRQRCGGGGCWSAGRGHHGHAEHGCGQRRVAAGGDRRR